MGSGGDGDTPGGVCQVLTGLLASPARDHRTACEVSRASGAESEYCRAADRPRVHHCQCRDREGFIDDFAVDGEGRWAGDGRELLTAAWNLLSARGMSTLRVVTAQADELKVAMLVAAGLQLVRQWWVKPIEAAEESGVAHGRVDGPGFSGILGPAPPVYDPGGPVLLADEISAEADLSALEEEAARMGSVLVVVPTEPDSDRERERALQDRAWTVASQWYVGKPHGGGSSAPAGPASRR